MIAHDSPSLFEALPTIRATLALTSRVSRLSKGRGIRSEMLRLSISRLLFLAKADAPRRPERPPWPFGPGVGARLLIDHLVRAQQDRRRYRKPERRDGLA